MNHYTAKRPLVRGLLAVAGLAILFVIPALVLAQTSQQVNIGLKEFMITPSKVTVTQGQPVRFTVTNNGTEEHNFTVENEKKGIEEKLFSSNLMPGETRSAEYTFPVAGDWEMYCPIDGHKDHGMKGDIEALSSAPGGMPSTGEPIYLGLWIVALFGVALLGGGLIARSILSRR